MKNEIYLLYVPIKVLKNDFKSGGPICIKLKDNKSIYLAFSSEELAKYAMEKKGINFKVISLKELGSTEFPALHFKVKDALVFNSKEIFDKYLWAFTPANIM